MSDVDLKRLNETISINHIATFDNLLHPSEAVQKLSDDNVKTELDWEIYQLQNKYLDYQINIGKRAFDIISKNGNGSQLAVANVRKNLDRFFQILDKLLATTGKRVNKDKNDISFFSDTVELTPYQLSSGEKQMLVILLTVLVQDNKNAILFLDEPEISLHIDWQKKLIQYIRELNPNVQVILATHSPAIIMEGWLDKVQEVSDLITLDRKMPANASK